ncbi:hypothetical protein [Acidovorax sp. SUPP2825]|uniref:hypothetical protein n=1 Tax=Acidovorax sp. SUPP2825 TaxID=2920879 RepID=UPI0023DE6609|nr:hypothetical protein [Acidovorax sp. SUPP2825]GKS97008.1 DUF3102 domain-containing protein [Acidovorax sp. SUPP2825]
MARPQLTDAQIEARFPKKTPVAADVQDVADKSIDQERFAADMAQMQADAGALTLAQAQRASSVRAVALQLGYQLPMDHIDPDLIQRDISSNMRRSVEACLEVGRGLRVLKEACEHGDFVERLDDLGVDRYVAARFMQAAVKFSNVPTSAHLTKAIGTQSKLLEMLILDDGQLEELALTGQTGELSLDDVATMSVKELRAALRETRAEKDAGDQLLEKKNAKIDQLERAQKRIAKLPPDEALAKTKNEATTILSETLGLVRGGLRQALIALNDAPDEASKQAFMAGLVGAVIVELNGLRDEFNLPETAGDGTPEWERWAKANPVDATPTTR